MTERNDLPAPPLRLPRRPREGHKGRFGRLLIVAGSRPYVGAARLAAAAALRGGAGLVELAVPRGIAAQILELGPIVRPLAEDAWGRIAYPALPTLRALAESADGLVIGPGLGTSEAHAAWLPRLLSGLDRPVVLDADALNALAGVPDALGGAAVRLLTPHPGEAARWLGRSIAEVQSDRLAAVRALAPVPGRVAVLKGAGTWVGEAGREWRCDLGNPGMATGGSGDILAGLLGSLLLQIPSPFDAARLAVWAHALAGDLAARRTGELALTPAHLLRALPQVLQSAEMHA